MYSRVFTILAVSIISNCITVNDPGRRAITSKSKIELNSVFITCGLSDIIILPAPFIPTKNTLYYLSKPNGEVINLGIPRRRTKRIIKNSTYDDIIINNLNDGIKIIKPGIDYKKIFNLIFGWPRDHVSNVIEEDTKEIDAEDVVIGPLLEEDHGNWVLSVYVKDIDEKWIEFFQVITIEITEIVPATPSNPQLHPGDTFNISFAYPQKNLESCEIVAPKSTFDRFYNRNRIDLDKCGFIIPNVTEKDEGIWKIRGVGRIVYEAKVFLKVTDINL